MIRATGLARQLSIAMAALSVLMIFVSTAAFYLVYAVVERLRLVALTPYEATDTTSLDIGITLGAAVIGLIIAVALAIWLARQIVRPLRAVGNAARRIAQGDLATRVTVAGAVHGETAALVEDFNAMANRLQRMAEDVSIWNAQIAHELRTPLTILQGRLQGAKDGVFPLDDALVEGLLGQVAGLTRLVEDLRSVSLGDSGRLDLTLTDFDLACEIEGMAPALRSILEPAGFSLAFDLKPGVVRADASRVRQAILALVENARRHADPCQVRIANSFSGELATIAVSDLGPGVPPELADDIFRQFVRGPHSRSGTGLGLAVVRAIARSHGGNVQYRTAGEASIFEITLRAHGIASQDPMQDIPARA